MVRVHAELSFASELHSLLLLLALGAGRRAAHGLRLGLPAVDADGVNRTTAPPFLTFPLQLLF